MLVLLSVAFREGLGKKNLVYFSVVSRHRIQTENCKKEAVGAEFTMVTTLEADTSFKNKCQSTKKSLILNV